MSALLILSLVGVALIALGTITLVWLRRRRRPMSHALRGDWWPRFEEAFREYARSSERTREPGQ